MPEQRIVANKVVHFTYFIVDQQGKQLERSDVPIGYVHGANSPILPKIGESLGGHKVGDVIEITLSPEEGFGPYREEMTFTDELSNVPAEFRQIGTQVEMQNDNGDVRQFRVAAITDDKLTLDGNHPLAGKTLTFTVTITEIRDASTGEIASGQLADGPDGQLQ